MYLTIRNYKVAPENVDEVVRRVDENWLEQVRRMSGFVSYYVARTGDGGLTSLTVFVDAEKAQLAQEASAEWVGGNLMDLDVQFQSMHEGPVVVRGGA